LGLGSLLLSFHPPVEVIIALSAICTDTLLVCIELIVAEEAYPQASPSSSEHWNKLFNGSGDITPVEEDGCP